MSLTIRCDRSTGVVEPSGEIIFEFVIADENGQPAAGQPIEVKPPSSNAVCVSTASERTGDDGKARIVVRGGAAPAKVDFAVRIGPLTQPVTAYVTNVHIDLPLGDPKLRDLKSEEEALLQMLFWNQERVSVLRQFGGGMSGSRVLQVESVGAHGANLSQVVKLGVRDSMLEERDRYRTSFAGRLARATPVSDSLVYGKRAAIVYGDAHVFGGDRPAQLSGSIVPLGDFFQSQGNEDVRAALLAILDDGLRNVHRYYEVKRAKYSGLVSRFMPEHLVVTLTDRKESQGVFRHSADRPCPEGAIEIEPRQVERQVVGSPGEVVFLRNFSVSKMQDDDLNLEDPEQKKYRVKVRYDGDVPAGITTGDKVDVLARVIADRQGRMSFAVSDCFAKYGVREHPLGWQVEGEIFPDPLSLLQWVLDQDCDVAWGTIHGDLHWENVMLASPDNWWLIDYGLTGPGPVLFDFIKLEVYLRTMVLAKESALSCAEILGFELALLENPLGELPERPLENPTLCMAAAAIRTIRRMARRYVLTDFFEYWRFLFAYAMALAKYYPTQDQWQSAERTGDVVAKLEQKGRTTFHAFALALVLGRAIFGDQRRGRVPRVNYRFVPFGTVLDTQPKAVALDVGRGCKPGVLDHHFAGGSQDCAATLVVRHPELLVQHVQDVPTDEVTWILHERPDFDCVASLLLAWHRIKHGFFPPGARRLAEYTLLVDAGAAFMDTAPLPEQAPYALFQAHQPDAIAVAEMSQAERDRRRAEYGWAVLEYLLNLESQGIPALAGNRVPPDHPFWPAIARDEKIFDHRDRLRAKAFQARVRAGAECREVGGLFMDAPDSCLFKAWARRRGFTLLVVRWPQPEKPAHRIVVSMPANWSKSLWGLGKALESLESQRRQAAGKPRPCPPQAQPRWPDVDNADPWYDGRSLIHNYTIVDAPGEGTLLEVDDILNIFKSGQWLESSFTADADLGK